ncbi:MAG: redox-regulated ATPase YchF [Bdellovibrionaceae bacterium]|nr:redox-regulated ATPase YchF [Pseudobdellovibrionaceae bacterium]
MALQVGIVGLPNVGKSTLFNALTAAKAESANYPFCTIDPNVGVVTVPDHRLTEISKFVKPQSVVPTAIEFVDIAGLVAGASKGEGLGNQFLANIREVDAILHVVRCFVDDNIIHVEGSVDALRDIETINTELLLADLDSVDKKYQKVEKVARTTKDKAMMGEAVLLKKFKDALESGKPARSVEITENDQEFMKHIHLLSMKPVLYVCNIGESEINNEESNIHVQKVKQIAKEENNECVTICTALEAEISQLPKDEQKEFLESAGLEEPGLNKLIKEAYKLLGLITYFTAGEKEVRAWTIRLGTKAPQAAGVIHSDFERGFIRAETFHCNELFTLKSEAAVKEAGKYRSEGKEYVVKDGDIMLFRFNV